jgi:hypothetical protein
MKRLLATNVAAVATLAAVGWGCSGTVGGPGGKAAVTDETAPIVTITSPTRGAIADGTRVTITGRAIDDDSGLAEVQINGQAVTVAGDGSFSVDLERPAGLSVLTTTAKDRAGNLGQDVRAVLLGPLAPVERPVTDALAVKLGPGALTVVGEVLGKLVTNLDLTPVVAAGNPVVSSGGSCLGVKVNVESIQKGPVAVALVPEAGQVSVGVAITSLDVRLRANYKVACIGGSSGVRIRATKTELVGKLGVGATAGKLTTAVSGVDLRFQGFDVDMSGLPGLIVDLLSGIVNDAVANAVRDAVKGAVPGLAQNLLSELDAADLPLSALGKSMTVTIRPQSLSVDASGLFAVIQSGVSVSGGAGVSYASTPHPADPGALAAMGSVGVGIADDLVNQLLAGLWASGAFEQSLALGADSPAALFFGPEVDRVTVSLSLPPTVSVAPNGELRLVVGDLIAEVVDDQTGPLAEIALSLDVGFSAQVTADGRLTLSLGTPGVAAQVLAQSPNLPTTLTTTTVSAMVELLAGQLTDQAGQGLLSLPIPAIGDALLMSPSVSTGGDFLLLRANLVAAP